ncbi:hypothetical protein N657DRAFT_244672 [Parathielavia appendiculata]|uniref:Uncharacterized protein n=1 Tax=Parathielavia appendiculata TaxID=2587402 RepID=A0AAN6Z003_9PEZI|nr:hypothetical protein N657DRAFT_244672 [Parathielavia appendiculata]
MVASSTETNRKNTPSNSWTPQRLLLSVYLFGSETSGPTPPPLSRRFVPKPRVSSRRHVDAVDAIQRAAGDLDDAPGSGAPPASAVPAPASATPMAAQPSGTGEPYAGTTSTDSQDALPVPRSSHKRPRVEADDASSVAFQAPVISSDLRAAAPFLIQPGLGQAPPPTPHGDGNWTRSPCESPTSQPHGIDSRASHPLPALPTADPQPERSVVHILFRPSSDMFEAAFPGVGLISAMAKSKQEFVGGRGYSAIANFYIYDDMATEMDICLGRADEQSCAYAADRVRTILGNVPGVSVEVQQVCQMKIVVLPHPESVHVGSMLAGIFI